MSITKRIRIMWYAAYQDWHIKTCCECSFKWWAIGPLRPELVDTCDFCKAEEIERFMRHAEYEYQKLKGVM